MTTDNDTHVRAGKDAWRSRIIERGIMHLHFSQNIRARFICSNFQIFFDEAINPPTKT